MKTIDVIKISCIRYSPIQKLHTLCQNVNVLELKKQKPKTIRDIEILMTLSYNIMKIMTNGIEKPKIIIVPRKYYLWLTLNNPSGKNNRMLGCRLLYSDELEDCFIMYRSKARLRYYPFSALICLFLNL